MKRRAFITLLGGAALRGRSRRGAAGALFDFIRPRCRKKREAS